MNLKQKLELKALVNLIVSVIERLANIALKFSNKKDNKIWTLWKK